MYRQQIAKKTSPSLSSTAINKKARSTSNNGSLSGTIQRATANPETLNRDEWQQLNSAIGTRASNEIRTGKRTSYVPEFKGISSQLWGDLGGNKAPIQAKLTIGAVGDKYEQEADRVAAEVVQQMSHPAPVANGRGEVVQGKENKKEEDELQLKPMMQRRADAGGEASADLTSAINSARGGGKPLDAGLQQSMGQAMGTDFSEVRVHTDAQSHRLNQSLQAKAFTTGQDVFFSQGAYQPGSQEGKKLLVHELTHVVQQNGGAVMRSPLQTQQFSQHPTTGQSGQITTLEQRKRELTEASEDTSSAIGENKGKMCLMNRIETKQMLYGKKNSVIQRHISWNGTLNQFEIDNTRPGWIGTVAAMPTGLLQTKNHIVPFAEIQNDLTLKLNAFVASSTRSNEQAIIDFTEALYPNRPAPDYTSMQTRRTDIINDIQARTTNNYHQHSRKLLSSLNSSPDNVRAGGTIENLRIGQNLDADFNPRHIIWPGGNVITPSGLVHKPPQDVLTLTSASNEIIYKYQEQSGAALSFVLSWLKSQLSSGVKPTVVPGVFAPALPVLVTDPTGNGSPYFYA